VGLGHLPFGDARSKEGEREGAGEGENTRGIDSRQDFRNGQIADGVDMGLEGGSR
jgi:hypothetical protein